ncbi:MAG: hypothetical protein COB00_17375 [Alcanivorax sp.]|nr:MAG: hypothetical protein COB00_17375 [Alcanivorax sp.]
MADRQVTATGKDEDGDIIRLCNSGSFWSPRSKADAIYDIENRIHRYFVRISYLEDVDIKVVTRDGKKYLRTDPDKTTSNNLDNLPDC